MSSNLFYLVFMFLKLRLQSLAKFGETTEAIFEADKDSC